MEVAELMPTATFGTIAQSVVARPTSWVIRTADAIPNARNTRNVVPAKLASISSVSTRAKELAATEPNAVSRTTRPFALAPRATLDIHSLLADLSTRAISATPILAVRMPIVNQALTVKETTGQSASAALDIWVIP